MWEKSECFILGGGPSLADVDVECLRGRRVIAVNNAYRLADWIDVLFFGDCRWYPVHRQALLSFAGLKVTRCEQHVDKPGIRVIKSRNTPRGLSRDQGVVGWNLSSGACAVNLATLFGARRVVLLGYDMRKVNGENNWHRDYQTKARHDPYARFLTAWPAIARDAKAMNVEIVNATPGSALDLFPIVDLRDVL